MIGFGLLTAAVSWLLSVYPVLEQRRSLAHRSTLLHAAEERARASVFDFPCPELSALLLAITEEVTTLRNSMSQFPVSYYFHGGEKETALPGILEYIRGIGEKATRSHDPSVQITGTMLSGAIIDYVELLAEVYLRMPSDDIPAGVEGLRQRSAARCCGIRARTDQQFTSRLDFAFQVIASASP